MSHANVLYSMYLHAEGTGVHDPTLVVLLVRPRLSAFKRHREPSLPRLRVAMPLLAFGPIVLLVVLAVFANPDRGDLVVPLLVGAAVFAVLLPLAVHLDNREHGGKHYTRD